MHSRVNRIVKEKEKNRLGISRFIIYRLMHMGKVGEGAQARPTSGFVESKRRSMRERCFSGSSSAQTESAETTISLSFVGFGVFRAFLVSL